MTSGFSVLEDKSEPTRSPRPGQKALFPEEVRAPVARAFPHHGPVFPAQKPLDEASIGSRCRLLCAGLGRPQCSGRTGSTVPARQYSGLLPSAWPPACSPWMLSLSPARISHLPPEVTLSPPTAHSGSRFSRSPHALGGRHARDGRGQLIPPPQPDLPPSVRRRQEDAQAEESKSVLQDDGELPDKCKEGGWVWGGGREEGEAERGENGGVCVYARVHGVVTLREVWTGPPRVGTVARNAQSAVLLLVP